jgi:hypothetical protein
MIDYVRTILTGQFEAALCMLHDCVRKCPAERWEDKIANLSFRQVAYHTLFFADYYLSPSETAFSLRELHGRGGDERRDGVCTGLSQAETLEYAAICREKAIDALAAETEASLRAEAAFARRTFSRGELHVYNLRHIQHHTGQLSAFLHKNVADADPRWIGSGWR